MVGEFQAVEAENGKDGKAFSPSSMSDMSSALFFAPFLDKTPPMGVEKKGERR
jgi:hypothetical protein